MSICQISIPCSDLEASERLYAAVLEPLNYKTSLRTRDKIFFTGRFQLHPELSLRRENTGAPTGGVRIALYASSKSTVDKFFTRGLTQSYTIQQGTSGHYPNAYKASITDFDGNVIEAIYLKSWWRKFIKAPVPLTGQVVIGVFYLVALAIIGILIQPLSVLIFGVLLMLVVAKIALSNPASTLARLEKVGAI